MKSSTLVVMTAILLVLAACGGQPKSSDVGFPRPEPDTNAKLSR